MNTYFKQHGSQQFIFYFFGNKEIKSYIGFVNTMKSFEKMFNFCILFKTVSIIKPQEFIYGGIFGQASYYSTIFRILHRNRAAGTISSHA
jgi:hypothetical protein